MISNKKSCIFIIAQILFVSTIFSQEIGTLESPNSNISMTLTTDGDGALFYTVNYKDDVFLEDSSLGLETSIGNFYSNLTNIATDTSTIRTSYELATAKTSNVDYSAKELRSTFINENEDTLVVTFRLSDRDVAYNYEIKSKDKSNIKILNEKSSFNLPDDAKTYISPQAPPMTGWMETKPSYEEEYTLAGKPGTASTYGVGYTFPALFKLEDNKGWVLISETGVDGRYPGSRLGEGNDEADYKIEFPQEGENNGIGETFAAQALPATTPWRTISLGETLKPIVETTVMYDLVEQKYSPSQDYNMGKASWSWIVWQDNSMNYEDQVTFIDLSHNMGFEYILVDANWDSNIGKDRMKDLIAYAHDKDVDILLWYNSNGYWNNAPQSPKNKMNNSIERRKEMEWLQEMGVKGLKIDFFGGDKQTTMQLYEDILTDANDYGLAVTFHGCTLPRGWEKMYPNFVTSEAVLASENLVFRQDALDKHALNATLLPFTRNAVGAMDFGPVFLNSRLSKDQERGTIRSTTDAFELATAIIYQSPIQHFGLTPSNLEEQPEHVLNFLKEVPTTWDETIYLGGEPEDYCALARRKDDKWYIAVVNGKKEKRTITVNIPMLAGTNARHLFDAKDNKANFKDTKIKNSGAIKLNLNSEGGAVLFSQ